MKTKLSVLLVVVATNLGCATTPGEDALFNVGRLGATLAPVPLLGPAVNALYLGRMKARSAGAEENLQRAEENLQEAEEKREAGPPPESISEAELRAKLLDNGVDPDCAWDKARAYWESIKPQYPGFTPQPGVVYGVSGEVRKATDRDCKINKSL